MDIVTRSTSDGPFLGGTLRAVTPGPRVRKVLRRLRTGNYHVKFDALRPALRRAPGLREKTIFFLLLLWLTGFAQDRKSERDTSFTIFSAAEKVAKKYPGARLVLPSLPGGVGAETGVVYVSYGSRRLELDIFFPLEKNASPAPCVVLIHGGGWSSGDRTMEIPMAQQLAAHGYVAATVDYRLSLESLYPAAVYDLKTAIRWLRGNAARYGIDTNRIAVYGCSSGGELAAFLGTTGSVKKFDAGPMTNYSSRVQAVVDVDGLVDFIDSNSTRYDDDPAKPSAAHRWFGGSYKEIPRTWNEASPVNYVDRKSPPLLFINSSIPHYHAGRDRMVLKLRKLGIYTEIHTIPDTPHPFWLFHPWFEKTLHYTLAFLDKVMK